MTPDSTLSEPMTTTEKTRLTLPGDVCGRLFEAMHQHATYGDCAVSLVRPSDLDVVLKAVTHRDDTPQSPAPAGLEGVTWDEREVARLIVLGEIQEAMPGWDDACIPDDRVDAKRPTARLIYKALFHPPKPEKA